MASDGQVQVRSFPVKHISEVKMRTASYLVDDIWPENSVGFSSGQPGSFKTWFDLELAVAVSSGALAFGVFETKKAKVLMFNGEDDPSTITRARIEAITRAKGLSLKDLDLLMLDIPLLQIDNQIDQKKFEETIKIHRPALVILDPFRNIHSLDEDKASQLAPLLNFFRSIQRKYETGIKLTHHDRKPNKDDYKMRRESRTRGSNALEGWRDTAIYLDRRRTSNEVAVMINHRGLKAPEPFDFRLIAKEQDGVLSTAVVEYFSGDDIVIQAREQLEERIREAMHENGSMTREDLRAKLKRRKGSLLKMIKRMIQNHDLEEFDDAGKTKLRFPEPKL